MSTQDRLKMAAVFARDHLGRPVLLLALLVWGAVPALIMVVLLCSPATFIRIADFWGVVALLWSVVSLVLFLFMLLGGYRRGGAVRVVESLAGLACTLILGLPAIVLSTLPLFGSPEEFLQSLNPDGTEVRLEEKAVETPIATKEKVLFLVGIDASSSFIQDANDERLGMVYQTLDSIFFSTDEYSLARSLNARDLIMFFAFAGESRLLHQNSENGEGRESLRIRPSQGLPGYINQLLSATRFDQPDSTEVKRRSTDLIGFMNNTICAQIRDRGSEFSRIKIILLSDLIHSTEVSGSSSDSNSTSRFDSLDDIEKCLKEQSAAISTTVFYLPSRGGNREELAGNELDIGHHMSSNLSMNKWEEINLADYSRAEWEEKAMMCESLYAKSDTSISPLYLKYRPLPEWEPIESRLHLPRTQETDRILLGLRPTGDPHSRIKVRFNNKLPQDFVLGFGGERDRAFASLDRTASEQNPLTLSIDDYPDSSLDSHFELLVAVPRLSVLYRIPVVVLTVMPAKTMAVLKSIFTILHLFPLALAFAIVVETTRDSRKSRKAIEQLGQAA